MPTVAVIGASPDRTKFGNKAVRAYASRGYHVYPVHPKEKEIEGFKAYSSVEQIPESKLDVVAFYVPPSVGLKVIDQVAAKEVGELWLNPGTESPAILERAEALGLNAIAA